MFQDNRAKILKGKEQVNMLVILVDQESLVLQIIGDFLRDAGHNVKKFRSYDDLAKNRKERAEEPGLILIDPGAGSQAAEKIICGINEHYPSAYIIIMSSENTTLPYETALTRKVFAYIKKPVRLNELELLVARVKERLRQ